MLRKLLKYALAAVGFFVLFLAVIWLFMTLGGEALVSARKSPPEPDAASQPQTVDSTFHPEDETFWDLAFSVRLAGGRTEPVHRWANGKGTYYYFLPSGSGTDAFHVSTKHGITLRKANEAGKETLLHFENGDALTGVECGAEYMLGCYDINNYHYETPVLFLQGENIPAMFIHTESGSMENVLADKQYKEPGSVTIADARSNIAYDGKLTYIKGRGNGSWWSVKKPFNIKLGEKTDLFGMGSAREWSLLSQATDRTCIRNKLSYDLAKDSGMAYSPDSEFIDLWIDGNYQGLYLLTDRIGISEGSVDITNLEEATEAVNLDKLSTYLQVVDTKRDASYSSVPNEPSDVTGGYLIEVDKFYGEAKFTKFAADRLRYVALKSPEYAGRNEFEYIRRLVLRTEKAIVSGSSAYKKYIDVESWAKMCIMQEVLANSDFMGSSQYFYKDADVDGTQSLIYAGPIWDMDLCLGNDINRINPNVFTLTSRSWLKYLYARRAFRETMESLYQDVYRPLLSALLESGIDAYAGRIEASAYMNYTRWPQKSAAEGTDPFSGSIAALKTYLSERLALFDSLWIDHEKFHTVSVTTEQTVHRNGYYFSLDYMVRHGEPLGALTPPESSGYRFTGWHYGTPSRVGKPYDPAAPVNANQKVCAQYLCLLDESAEALEELGYSLMDCNELDCYLRLIDKKEYTVFLSVAKRGGQLLGAKHLEELVMLGVHTDLNTIQNDSYIAIIEGGSCVLEKNLSGSAVSTAGTLFDGTAYTLSSAAGAANGGAVLTVNGENAFVNQSGLNIAVFDNASGTPVLVDSVCFNLQYDLIATRERAAAAQ